VISQPFTLPLDRLHLATAATEPRPLYGVEPEHDLVFGAGRHRARRATQGVNAARRPAGVNGKAPGKRAAAHPGIPAIVASDRRERPGPVPASCSADSFIPARISVRDAKEPPTLLKFRMRAIPIWSDAVPVQKIVKVKS
jgi:hypothetical protein